MGERLQHFLMYILFTLSQSFTFHVVHVKVLATGSSTLRDTTINNKSVASNISCRITRKPNNCVSHIEAVSHSPHWNVVLGDFSKHLLLLFLLTQAEVFDQRRIHESRDDSIESNVLRSIHDTCTLRISDDGCFGCCVSYLRFADVSKCGNRGIVDDTSARGLVLHYRYNSMTTPIDRMEIDVDLLHPLLFGHRRGRAGHCCSDVVDEDIYLAIFCHGCFHEGLHFLSLCHIAGYDVAFCLRIIFQKTFLCIRCGLQPKITPEDLASVEAEHSCSSGAIAPCLRSWNSNLTYPRYESDFAFEIWKAWKRCWCFVYCRNR